MCAEWMDTMSVQVGDVMDSSNWHDRVCARKGGPGRIEYLEQLYKYAGLRKKPYRPQWEPYKSWDGFGNDSFHRHRQAQVEYLTERNEKANLTVQIEQLTEEIAGLV